MQFLRHIDYSVLRLNSQESCSSHNIIISSAARHTASFALCVPLLFAPFLARRLSLREFPVYSTICFLRRFELTVYNYLNFVHISSAPRSTHRNSTFFYINHCLVPLLPPDLKTRKRKIGRAHV